MNNIAEARKNKGLSRADLATAVNCSRSFISMVEAGKKNVSREMAKKMAEVLGIPPSAVIYPTEPFIEQIFSP